MASSLILNFHPSTSPNGHSISHSLCYEISREMRDAQPLIQFRFKGLTIPVKEWQVYVLVHPHVTELCIVRMSSRFHTPIFLCLAGELPFTLLLGARMKGTLIRNANHRIWFDRWIGIDHRPLVDDYNSVQRGLQSLNVRYRKHLFGLSLSRAVVLSI